MRITMIGSGNVATHLGAALKNAGHSIVQVYSRDIQHAALLAYHLKAEAIDNFDAINPDTGLFIIAVKDDAITEVTDLLYRNKKTIVHTSGATGISALVNITPLAGVFYPLQTFNKNIEVDFNKVPICLEGANDQITTQLTELAHTITNNVYLVNSYQRRILHLAAVFACNFTNYFYQVAGDLLSQYNMEFDLLRPLILETAQKVQTNLPANVQTGPAIRHDLETMESHLQLLSNKPDLQQLYTLISQFIIKMDVDRGEDK